MKSKSGSLTIFLALSMLVVLTFCLVLTEGVRVYFLKAKAAQAMELADFSVLSEYQYELLANYGMLFLDLDYEQGREEASVLEQRARTYLLKNAEEIETVSLEAEKFQRATDNGGLPFFRQAVEAMKVRNGYKFLEEIMDASGGIAEPSIDLGKILEENTQAAETLLGQYVDEEGEPLFEISLPKVSFPSIPALTEAVFGSESILSDKSVALEQRILNRKLSVGDGEKEKIGLADMQLFHGYLFEHFNYYGAKKPDVWNSALEYQMEYIIAGEASDRENVKNIMWRIFLLRASGNYLLYHQDADRMALAEAEAVLLAGITGNPVIIDLVREILLILQAIEDAIQETKSIFAGEKVPLYQDGIFDSIEIGYEGYLYLFLNTTDKAKKIYRSMDLVELEIREKSGYQEFRLDHCTDSFEVEWTYQFESLFIKIPLLDGGIYENTIRRKIFYEI